MGPQGPAGTTSLVSATFVTGATGTIPNTNPPIDGGCNIGTGDGFAFLGGAGSQVAVTLGANQVINVTGALDLSGGTLNVSNLLLDICYESLGTGFVVPGTSFGTPTAPLAVPANARLPVVLSKALETPDQTSLPPGQYEVGLCGCVHGADVWQSGFSWLSVQVLQQ
jgi:hypothetical protein